MEFGEQVPLAPATKKKKPRLGLVGLGLVGTALAERLLAAGYTVIAYDIDEKRRDVLATIGGTPVSALNEVLDNVDCLLLSLPNSEVVEAVIASLKPQLEWGQIILDTTTGEPNRVATMGALLADRGVQYCDATIVGSSAQVRTGEAVVLVGGDHGAINYCKSILSCFCNQIFELGEHGSGARMKLVVNLVLGLNRAALAEGLSFAKTCGIDQALALEVLRAGVSYSAVMDTKGPKMIAGDFSPQGRLSQHAKDVAIILKIAGDANRLLPLSATHFEILERAEDLGLGPLDNSAIVQVYEADTPP